MRSIIFTIVAMAFAIPVAQAAECNPQSDEELKQLLVAHSPFEGDWHLRQYSGKTKLSFDEVAGVPFAIWKGTDQHRSWGPDRQYMLTIVGSNRIVFDSGEFGKLRVELAGNCNIEIVQNHPNGQITHDLDSAPKTPAVSSSGPFNTNEELTEYLVDGSPFIGEWYWADKSGENTFSFEPAGSSLRVHLYDKTATVRILEPNLIRFIHPDGTFHLEVRADGVLEGVQEYDRIYAVITSANPAGGNLVMK